MKEELTFRVRIKAKSETWFDPAHDRLSSGFEDRPHDQEVRLGTWEEQHGTGYTIREVVLPYSDLPVLYRWMDGVLITTISRVEEELTKLEAELDEYKAALHRVDREAYMEIFTRRASGEP